MDTRTFSYNTDGRIAAATNSVGSYTYIYNDAGQLTELDQPFGVSLTFGYDVQGHRNVVEDSFGGRIDSTYNALGQLASRVFQQPDQPTLRIDFEYDSQGRCRHDAGGGIRFQL